MKKKILAVALLSCFVLGAPAVYAEGENTASSVSMEDKSVYIDGVKAGSVIEKGDTLLVAVREVAEGLGYKVEWVAESKTIILTKGAQYITMSIDVDGYTIAKTAPMPLGTAPEIIKGKTYVPFELFTDIMEFSANIDENGVHLITVDEVKGSGVVKSVEDGGILFEDSEIGEVYLNIGEDAEITDSEGNMAQVTDITEGCELEVVYGDAMMYSLPPHNNPKSVVIKVKAENTVGADLVEKLSIKGTVKETEDGFVVVESEDKNGAYPIVALNVTENTKSDEVKAGDKVEAEFSPVMTRSIPPQSEAFSIKIIK